ncbi:MAG: ATP-dependent helicase [Bernardetiaceae bacterium]|nr:ATP-dependent helicase [Bernardetiaceae bacterium]
MMKLTAEQKAIIQSKGNLKINAVAGSGKTTTIIEYAKSRPSEAKILYLAFNRSVREEAQRRFAGLGLHNVRIETAHSLAYNAVVRQRNYQVNPTGYKLNELVNLLKIRSKGQLHDEYIIANHVLNFTAYFCNSDKAKVQEINYLDTVFDDKAITFVENFYEEIEKYTRIFLKYMHEGKCNVTHDFYLKMYQLSKPQLYYDYILFDEGQDASPVMLDIFFNQKQATKVIVGDTHQQIYAWRFAVNSLEQTDYPILHLSTSFRFPQAIADLASDVLDVKSYFQEHKRVTIKGKGKNPNSESQPEAIAFLARTNIGLLEVAINVTHSKENFSDPIYFEGNIHSYTYADSGTSLYDVLNLYQGKHRNIKDPLIRKMQEIDELEDYIEKTGDANLSMMLKLVKQYGNEIPDLIEDLKKLHIAEGKNREDAHFIFSTVHKAKGMEYDCVALANDFVKEVEIKANFEHKKEVPKTAQIRNNEEINLLYVAVTRAKSRVCIHESLVPEKTNTEAESIEVLKPVEKKADKS